MNAIQVPTPGELVVVCKVLFALLHAAKLAIARFYETKEHRKAARCLGREERIMDLCHVEI
jgi:hypothetical protein